MNKEIDLSVSCYGKTRELVYDLVLLPWGATEPHNLHLPYLTDCILAHAIAVDAAERSKELYGVRCMVMHPVTMGSQNPGQRELPFCIHARYETQGNSYGYRGFTPYTGHSQNGDYQWTWRE